MGILSTDFFDDLTGWKADLYIALDAFIESPSEETHDMVAGLIKENCVQLQNWDEHDSVIAICNETRKRDALAIQGPAEMRSMMRTWKASKHTPRSMRGCWKNRRFSNNLYIHRTRTFLSTHEVYALPEEIYDSLVKQFKSI